MTTPSTSPAEHRVCRGSTSDADQCPHDGSHQAGRATWAVALVAWALVATIIDATWQVGRMILYALLVLIEPLLRMLLVSLAYLSFLVTLIFGFLIGEPNFPKWGMLGFSVGMLCAYWLLLALMSVVGGVRRGRD